MKSGSRVSLLLAASLFSFVTPSLGEASGLLTGIDLLAPETSFEHLLMRVSDQAMKPRSGLSLGESHLESGTANEVFDRIVGAWLESPPAKLKTCIETNTGLLDSSSFPRVRKLSRKVLITKGNSPSVTDFKTCEDRKSHHYLVHSGFFHQHPFARAFPDVFPRSPVITEPHNNIRSQMKKVDLLLITQMELPYLISQETKRLLKIARTDWERFVREQEENEAAVARLREAMEVLVENAEAHRTKLGVVLSGENFPSHADAFPGGTWLLLTDLGHRVEHPGFPFLRQLVELAAKAPALKKKLASEEFHFTSGLMPSAPGEGRFSYPGIEESFGGETRFLASKSLILVLDPQHMELRCFLPSAGRFHVEKSCVSAFQP